MFDTLDDADRRVLTALRNSVEEVIQPTPVDQILARGAKKRRRRLATRTLTGTAVAAALTGAVLTITGATSPAHPDANLATRKMTALNVELAGWSAHTNADSTLTITLRDPHLFDFQHPQLVDADRLRATLASAGVPVVLEFHDLTAAKGMTEIDCHVGPDESALTERVVVDNRQDSRDGSTWTITVRPAEMPPGAVLQLFLAPDRTTIVDRTGAVVGHGYSWATGAVVFATTPPPCTLRPVAPGATPPPPRTP
jgi:hypothetical protein